MRRRGRREIFGNPLLILNQNTATTVQMGLTNARLVFGLLDRAVGVREGLGTAPAHPPVQAEEREQAQAEHGHPTVALTLPC